MWRSIYVELSIDWPEIPGAQGHTLAPELPVGFYYPRDEQKFNSANEQTAAKLESTSFSAF